VRFTERAAAERIITVPDEKEIIKAMEEIRKNPSYVA